EIAETLKKSGIRLKLDVSDQSAGWKFAEYEMKGVPLRLEIGPKDIEKGQCVLVSRLDREKRFVPLEGLAETVSSLLDDIQDQMLKKAKENRDRHIYTAKTLEEMKETAKTKPGFVKAMWCGDLECELKIKEETGMPSRCIPFEQEHIGDVCPVCSKPAKHMVVWGIAY
ncbi:MAG: His/Gly/Thr/Pro-type tRNA ligase C-terminal domain-containing protein, partial [Bacillota bacterium]|nr:His/Gly/Thr/Pro-type tRNA ligase C-terminal domain-containing protein [Bacillota bacterium]